MGFNRVADFCRKTTIGKSTFYRNRQLPADHPEHIPEPDAFLNRGHTPVWTDETLERWMAKQVEAARATRARELLLSRRAAAVRSTAAAT